MSPKGQDGKEKQGPEKIPSGNGLLGHQGRLALEGKRAGGHLKGFHRAPLKTEGPEETTY